MCLLSLNPKYKEVLSFNRALRFIFILSFSLSLFCHSSNAFSGTMTIEGYVIDDASYVHVDVKVKGLSAAELGTDANLYKNRLEIYVKDADSAKPIIQDLSLQIGESRNNEFYWEASDPVKTDDDEHFDLTYSLSIYGNSNISATHTIQTLLDDKNGFRVAAEFIPVTGSVTTNSVEGVILKQIFGKPNEAPDSISISSAHKGLLVEWKGGQKVKYTSASDDVESYLPSKMLVMYFSRDEGAIDLPAKKINSSDGNHEETTCKYSFVDEESPCISCDDETDSIFIDTNDFPAAYKLESNKNESSSVSINNLSVGDEYVVVLQYEQGAKRSQCFIAEATETVSLSEINGETKETVGDPRCFIVTASYGSDLAKHVSIFRWFRDEFLMPYEFGKNLVENYYHNSQPLAGAISESFSLKLLFQAILIPFGIFLYFFRWVFENTLGQVLLLLLGLTLIFLRMKIVKQGRTI